MRIFVDEGALGAGHLVLDGQPARHVLKVLRMKPGQALILFDGKGGEYPAVLTACGRSSIELSVSARREVSTESPLNTRLVIAVPRGERMDIVVQKATELGVSEILPVLTEHTVVKLGGARAEGRMRHWRRVAASACEQCGRNVIPDIAQIRSLTELPGALGAIRPDELRLMPEPAAGPSLPAPRHEISSVTLLVGPEGGFTQGEIDAALEAGFQLVSLGPRILRTETAAISLLSVAQWTWGDMRSPEAG